MPYTYVNYVIIHTTVILGLSTTIHSSFHCCAPPLGYNIWLGDKLEFVCDSLDKYW